MSHNRLIEMWEGIQRTGHAMRVAQSRRVGWIVDADCFYIETGEALAQQGMIEPDAGIRWVMTDVGKTTSTSRLLALMMHERANKAKETHALGLPPKRDRHKIQVACSKTEEAVIDAAVQYVSARRVAATKPGVVDKAYVALEKAVENLG